MRTLGDRWHAFGRDPIGPADLTCAAVKFRISRVIPPRDFKALGGPDEGGPWKRRGVSGRHIPARHGAPVWTIVDRARNYGGGPKFSRRTAAFVAASVAVEDSPTVQLLRARPAMIESSLIPTP